MKEKGECLNYFLYAQLNRDGRNETESAHTMQLAIDLKASEIDLHVIEQDLSNESEKVTWP